MVLSTCLILLSLSKLSYAVPLRDRFDNSDYQVLFSALPQPSGTTPSLLTSTSATASVSSVQAQDVQTPANPPTVSSVWFAPDNDIPPMPMATPPSSSYNVPQSSFRQIVAAYYPDWTADQLPPEMVDFDRLDWVDFAFAVPDSSTLIPNFLETDSEDILKRLVSAAHSKNKKVKVSIGGWTGSGHFSSAVNSANRNAFAANILALYTKFNIDGIDIDWEYPGEAGAPGNIYTSEDSANFLAFLRILRSILPPGAYITAATQVWPFMDASGEHSKDVSAFAQVLDWVLLMNYDVWGSSSSPGPNAPLDDACHNSSQPGANAHGAIASWTAAGFPPHKIMLGLPAYGYVSKSTAQSLRTRRRRGDPESTFLSALAANKAKTQTFPGITAIISETGSAESGQIQFKALIARGALVKNAPGVTPMFTGSGGFERIWDTCSSTPFLRSSLAGQIVTYDDPESLGAKAAFAKEVGILGVNMWDAHGDTAEWDLIDSVRAGLGLE